MLLLMTAPLSGCSESQPATAGGLPDYDPELVRRLVAEEDAVVLDVRTRAEFRTGHAPKARNIEVSSIQDRLQEVEALVEGDKTRAIVVYCGQGPRAAEAKRILLSAGYTRVTNLGGLRNWPR